MIVPLITLQDMQQFIPSISSNIDFNEDMQQHILDAMEFDLQPFMGESFYLDFLSKFATQPSPIDDLWQGVEYTYSGSQYKHQGLKAVLVYHAHARYLPEADLFSTPYGMAHNNNEFSNPASEKKIARIQSAARSKAGAHENRVLDYLSRNAALFPLFKCSEKTTTRKTGVKIRNIG